MENNKKAFVLQINAGSTQGGAATIAKNLFYNLDKQHFVSKLATSNKIDKKDFLQIPRKSYLSPKNSWEKLLFAMCKKTEKYIGKIKGAGRFTNAVFNIARPSCLIKNIRGVENFENYPGTWDFFKNIDRFPDIIHCHNLHGRYFDIRILPYLSKKAPVVLTLHDEWMLTGHCAGTFGCTKWKTGCGKCQNLKTYDHLWRDTTKYNFKQKQNIYKKSKLHIVTPSQWLMDKVKQSILADGALSYNVIYNGVDLNIFKPGDKQKARIKNKLPNNAYVLIYLAHQAKTNGFKDYAALEKAMFHLAEQNKLDKKLILLCIGEKSDTIKKNNCEIRFYKYINNLEELVTYYQAADVLVHAAKSDNFPTTILEALACGLPIIGTNVGGIPEQIEKTTGMLYELGNYKELAEKIYFLLTNLDLRKKMGKSARIKAEEKFDLKKQIGSYVEIYKKLLKNKNRDMPNEQ